MPATRTNFVEKRRQHLFEMVNGARALPSTFAAPLRVLQLRRNPDASMKDFADAISTDPWLSTKILAVASSAAMGPAVPVIRLSQAITRIGLKNLLPLVFGFSLSGIFSKTGLPPSERTCLWKAALLKAIAARECARHFAPDLMEEAFLCGLLQDVGIPFIYAADPAAWSEASATLMMDSPAEREEREHAIYGTDHAALGGLLATHMGLSEMFRHAIRTHHKCASGMGAVGSPGMASSLDVAASLPHRIIDVNQSIVRRLTHKVKLAMGDGSAEQVNEIVVAIAREHRSTLTQLGGADESGPAFKQFLQAVSEEVAVSLELAISESVSTIHGLRAREERLAGLIDELKVKAIQSDYDSMTKALNRRGFVTRLDRLLGMARQQEVRCMVGFADVDNLKQINDRLGHAVGDEAINTLCNQLISTIKGKGLVGRLGGDEFAFAVVACDAETERAFVADLDSAFSGLVIGKPPATWNLTISRGLSPLGIPTAADNAEGALAQADQLMYAAKHGGKARCVLGKVA